ncbi:serine protease [Pseudoxanthomonas sangjuensis]|uniref:PA domain-containing protein n=1 Tax=Pseudoxanthomonas sangjuensis TaxID=1503750 RepID=UPI0013907D4D|nr:PA domain-containing protein [Pseudoxanthomonas sangjuensis]KAF1713681.1 serine protease [Pseudoxanthomonas sangjuensis]
MNKPLLASALALALAALSGNADAARVVLYNLDPAGVGLNDPTPIAPTGANPGTTVGEQRRIAYLFAADLWGSVLQSDVDIKVYASFAPLSCAATSGVLGSAGPNWIVYNFPGVDPNVLYPSALGDAIAGEDLVPDPQDPGDIASQFNGNLGQPGCLESFSWYYGLDGNTPPGAINFLNVVMHEIGHGLGFSGFLNKTSGALLAGLPDVYTRLAYDNVSNLRFTDAGMTNATRALAMRTPGRTVWDGAEVSAQAPLILDEAVLLRLTGSLTAGYTYYGTAAFGAPATPANFSGELVLADDGVGPDTADACEPLPAGSLTGKIAFMNRGTCGFEFKALNAENAGAIGAVIGNVASSGTPGTAPGMAEDPAITATIPTLSLGLAEADAIRAALPGIDISLGTIPGRLAGGDANGRVQLYAPTTVASGSTFSHFDTLLSPNAVMEPNITDTLHAEANLDLTPALLDDLGWVLNPGNAKIGNCTTNVDVVGDGGLIPGANVQAWSNLCLRTSPSKAVYQNCMSAYKDRALAVGILTGNQGGKVAACAAKILK